MVSQANVDFAAGTVAGENCTVGSFTKPAPDAKGFSFQRTDKALPLPIQGDWIALLPYMNDLKDLNWYGLKVTGLEAGNYTLSIDGVDLAQFSAEALAKGVNVGNIARGPVFDQSQKAFQLINQKNGLLHQRFRGVVMFNVPDWLADVGNERKAQELKKRMDVIQQKQAEIYTAVKPVARKFTLTKIN